MSNKIDKNAEKKKKYFKLIGFICLPIGALCFFIAVVSMMSFNFSLFPPLVFVGGVCLMMAYQGSVARYNASVNAPIIKDTINYMAEETKETLANVANEIKDKKIICPNCNEENDYDAKYCDNCGKQLVKICAKCSMKNDADAVFCKSCGERI